MPTTHAQFVGSPSSHQAAVCRALAAIARSARIPVPAPLEPLPSAVAYAAYRIARSLLQQAAHTRPPRSADASGATAPEAGGDGGHMPAAMLSASSALSGDGDAVAGAPSAAARNDHGVGGCGCRWRAGPSSACTRVCTATGLEHTGGELASNSSVRGARATAPGSFAEFDEFDEFDDWQHSPRFDTRVPPSASLPSATPIPHSASPLAHASTCSRAPSAA